MGHLTHKLVLLNLLDLVSGMAVLAVGQFFIRIISHRTVNTVHKLLIYPLMAGSTGRQDILEMDRGLFQLSTENEMRVVTVGTYRAG